MPSAVLSVLLLATVLILYKNPMRQVLLSHFTDGKEGGKIADVGQESTQSGSVLALAILRPCGLSDNGPGAGLGLVGRFPFSEGVWGSYAPTSTVSFFCPVSWKVRQQRCGRKSCGHSPPGCRPRSRMRPLRLLRTAALLLALAPPREASRHCGLLEYWNPDNQCCGSCLQRFGPPPSPDLEFSENCGLNDFGDHVTPPFKECPPGQCNPDRAELCSPCGGGATAPTPAGRRGGTRLRCREKPVPTKELCRPSVLSSQEPSSPATSSLPGTSERNVPQQALPSFALPLVLVLLLTSTVMLLLALRRHCRRRGQGKAGLHTYPASACGDPNTQGLTSLESSPGSLEASEAGHSWKEVSLLPLLGREFLSLASQPLSRLLDELEVLEELIVLLDPEPGPGGAIACGTTRHLAARYGLPAAWSTFAYSLRPSRSPLRALIEMVVAREPSASLGQLGTHLAQLGRADALRVLSKLG
ncbi:IGF-like family receptor 1 isoform X1 [Equus quagga]|uniref:IGF-like family receptor 1 isoform X1 n=2 Tax=Equus quagga TaxID=89248 RepID=UPI001EE17312|nr:IGF-like family receptor 1 isoform X1 [Equus quagga]